MIVANCRRAWQARTDVASIAHGTSVTVVARCGVRNGLDGAGSGVAGCGAAWVRRLRAVSDRRAMLRGCLSTGCAAFRAAGGNCSNQKEYPGQGGWGCAPQPKGQPVRGDVRHQVPLVCTAATFKAPTPNEACCGVSEEALLASNRASMAPPRGQATRAEGQRRFSYHGCVSIQDLSQHPTQWLGHDGADCQPWMLAPEVAPYRMALWVDVDHHPAALVG